MEQASVKDIMDAVILHLKNASDLAVQMEKQYGIEVINLAIMPRENTIPDIHLGCGIDEAAEALGKRAMTDECCGRCFRRFSYMGAVIHQLAEYQKPHFLRAFEKKAR